MTVCGDPVLYKILFKSNVVNISPASLIVLDYTRHYYVIAHVASFLLVRDSSVTPTQLPSAASLPLRPLAMESSFAADELPNVVCLAVAAPRVGGVAVQHSVTADRLAVPEHLIAAARHAEGVSTQNGRRTHLAMF